jgi:hypothetical protein
MRREASFGNVNLPTGELLIDVGKKRREHSGLLCGFWRLIRLLVAVGAIEVAGVARHVKQLHLVGFATIDEIEVGLAVLAFLGARLHDVASLDVLFREHTALAGQERRFLGVEQIGVTTEQVDDVVLIRARDGRNHIES